MYLIWGYLQKRSHVSAHSINKVINFFYNFTFEFTFSKTWHEICQISQWNMLNFTMKSADFTWNLKSTTKMPNELRSHGSIFFSDKVASSKTNVAGLVFLTWNDKWHNPTDFQGCFEMKLDAAYSNAFLDIPKLMITKVFHPNSF